MKTPLDREWYVLLWDDALIGSDEAGLVRVHDGGNPCAVDYLETLASAKIVRKNLSRLGLKIAKVTMTLEIVDEGEEA